MKENQTKKIEKKKKEKEKHERGILYKDIAFSFP